VEEFLKSFNYIACREKSLADFVNQETSSRSSIVVDPVFLQPASFYEKICAEPEEKGYILIYAVMEKADKLVEAAMKLAKEKNLAVVDISDDRTILYHSKQGERVTRYDIGVEEWLGYMKNASYIFTNSFHCCCFSIIFNKEFYVGKRDGDKINYLLRIFGLQSRRITADTVFGAEQIDYERVNALREQYSKASGEFVLQSIEKTQQGKHQKKGSFRPLKRLWAKSNGKGIERFPNCQ
jgi:hypothetical protein